LTAAAHVIHFDRWWNPAVENQATDRAFRIGQQRNVLVHKFITSGTIEERIDALLAEKRQFADDILSSDGEVNLTELPDEELLQLVRLDVTRALL
jgi:non-specific serine/threonine protein kinase